MNPCENQPEVAPDYHAGALSAPEAARYEAHLAACGSCRTADAEYREGLGLLAPWPVEPSSVSDAEFLATLFASAKRLETSSGSAASVQTRPGPLTVVGGGLASRRSRVAWAPVAMAASILLLIGGLAWRESHVPVRAPLSTDLAEVEGDDSQLAWADLSGLEDSLLSDPSSLAELTTLDEDGELDSTAVEDELWSDLGRDEGLYEEAWPGTEGSLEDEIDQLDGDQRAHLMELFEQG